MKVEILSKQGTKVVDLNRRRAIRERCLNCSGWSPQEVTNCEHTDCPLYPFRTGTGRQDAKERDKAIREYCKWCMASEAPSKCVARTCPLFAYRKSGVDRSVGVKDLAEKGRIAANFKG